MNCNTCFFSRKNLLGETICCRFPPTLNPATRQISPNDWCGEYKKNPSTRFVPWAEWMRDLELPVIAQGVLRRNGIHSISQLSSMTKAELMKCKGMGPKIYNMLFKCLQNAGVKFHD